MSKEETEKPVKVHCFEIDYSQFVACDRPGRHTLAVKNNYNTYAGDEILLTVKDQPNNTASIRSEITGVLINAPGLRSGWCIITFIVQKQNNDK